MASVLVITEVERLQQEIVSAVRGLSEMPGIYVSLNKTQRSVAQILSAEKINPENIFFVDCVTKDTDKDVVHIPPDKLEYLYTALEAFIREIKGDKYLLIDALSTLLIYNDVNKVARFVRQVTELASKNRVVVMAFSPVTRGEELLEKIFNFFDKVEKP